MPRILLYCPLLLTVLTSLASGQASPSVLAAPPGDRITLPNDAISATWSVHGGSLRWQSLTNHFTGASLPLDGSVLELVPKEGPVLHSSNFKMVAAPVLRDVPASPASG